MLTVKSFYLYFSHGINTTVICEFLYSFFRFAGMSSCSNTTDAAKSLFVFGGWFLTAVLYLNRLLCSFPVLSLFSSSFFFWNLFRYLKLKEGENQTGIRSRTGGSHQVGMNTGEVYALERVWKKANLEHWYDERFRISLIWNCGVLAKTWKDASYPRQYMCTGRCEEHVNLRASNFIKRAVHRRVRPSGGGCSEFLSALFYSCMCITHSDLRGSPFIARPPAAPCHLLIHPSLCFSHSVSLSESQCSHHPTLCGETRASDVWECYKAWEE